MPSTPPPILDYSAPPAKKSPPQALGCLVGILVTFIEVVVVIVAIAATSIIPQLFIGRTGLAIAVWVGFMLLLVGITVLIVKSLDWLVSWLVR
jgi:hypothetical protein